MVFLRQTTSPHLVQSHTKYYIIVAFLVGCTSLSSLHFFSCCIRCVLWWTGIIFCISHFFTTCLVGYNLSMNMSSDSATEKVVSNLILSCIKKRDTAGLKKLIDKGTSVDATITEGGQSLVILACSALDMNTVQMLVNEGCNINYVDKSSTSVATILASNGGEALLQYLLDNGLEKELLSKPNYQGCTPAHFAAQMGTVLLFYDAQQ